MAKSANQKLKLIYLLDKFMRDTDEQHGITIKDISEYLERYDIKSERKSLYDDIETLRNYGLDIVKEKSDKKVYYKLLSRDFELAELKLLVDSVQAAKFITAKKTDELIRKLEGLASRYEAMDLQRQVHVINRVKNPNERIYLSVDALHKAIHNDVQVTFKYAEWNLHKELVPKYNGKEYHISPWALTWDDENYYLIGYDEDDEKIKHFRVDKLLSLKEAEIPRHGREHFDRFDLAAYSKKMFGMYGGEEDRVKLKVKNYLVGVMLDRFGTDIMIIPDKAEGYFTINVDVIVSNQFIGWLAGLGADVSVVAPHAVRERVRDYISKIALVYEN